MAVKLENGDYVFDRRGRITEVSGKAELLERALIRLKAKKGRFSLDTELGSELYQIDLNNADQDTIETMIIEALSPIPEIRVTGVEKSIDRSHDRILLTIYLTIEGESALLEFSR